MSDRSDRSDRGHFNSATKKSVWEAMKANGWGWEAMSFASHFQASFSGFWGGEFLMQPRYAKVTTLEIDTCLTGRGMNSPALAALDDVSKKPFKVSFQ